jgi:DNA helicase-2/ATP-dependent DNA helicase PcrA
MHAQENSIGQPKAESQPKSKALSGLNSKQKEAVLTLNGPLLILAGAGAGKTKTVTHRILNLIENGVAPESILAITFTNKAAKEMRERVEHLLKDSREMNLPIHNFSKPFLSTFHSLCVNILKESGLAIGIPRHFTIYDKSDSKQAIKEAINSLGYDIKLVEPNKIMSIISREKSNFSSLGEYEAVNGEDHFGAIVVAVWRKYAEALFNEKALDFDDLLYKTAVLLKSKPEIRAQYQNRFKYIHIDEYQDTNGIQYELARLLVGPEHNIAVVGDIDQAIYSWRGANIKNIMKFEEDYPEAKVILLEENYRSTKTILSAANEIIKKNIFRKEKNLFTNNEDGELITLYNAYDENDEANHVANTARDLIKEGNGKGDTDIKPESIAVLYRTNSQSRALEEAFLRKGIQYQLLGTRFFERREVKDVISYARAALNPESLADIKRIINTPVRGIGKVTLLKIMARQTGDLPSGTKIKVDAFYKLLADIKNQIETQRPSTAIKYIIEKTGIESALKAENDKEEDRVGNVRELVTLATRFDDLPGQEGIEKLIEDAVLASDQDSLNEKTAKNNGEGVKLMTVHASKGLEFDYVFITGLEQDLFPSGRSNESKSGEDSEEERRLFYVAITRARKKLYLSYANMRTIFGSKQINLPSEFIADISDELIDRDEEEVVSGIKSIFIDF